MKLYQLLWILLKDGLRGRWSSEVFLAVDWNTPERNGSVSGPITSFRWELHPEERFCVINAESEDGPWSNSDEDRIAELIEASSLGTPEAKALRDSVPDETVDKIMRRVREIEAEEQQAKDRDLVKVTVNLTNAAFAAVETAAEREGLSRTDAINRAVQMWEQFTANPGSAFIYDESNAP